MKFKYYLRGFGVGVLFATVLLIIALAVHNNKNKSVDKDISSSGNISQIIKENDTSHKEETTKDSESDTESSTQPITETTTEPLEKITTESVTIETTEKVEETTTEPVTEPPTEIITEPVTESPTETIIEPVTQPVIDSTINQGATVSLTITPGMTSNTAADLLQSLGVVESGYDLNMYLYNNGYEAKLKVGTFEVPVGASYQDIAQIITR